MMRYFCFVMVASFLLLNSAARADDMAEEVAEYCSRIINDFKAAKDPANPSTKEFLNAVRLKSGGWVLHCTLSMPAVAPDLYVYLYQDKAKGAWVQENIQTTGCGVLKETEAGFSIEYTEYCVTRGYNEPPCKLLRDIFTVEKDQSLKKTHEVVRVSPKCEFCPTGKNCVALLRDAAAKAYKAGKPERSVEILQSLIDDYYYMDMYTGNQTVDGWALSDLLLYKVKAGSGCQEFVSEYGDYETLKGKAAKAFQHNVKLCQTAGKAAPAPEKKK